MASACSPSPRARLSRPMRGRDQHADHAGRPGRDQVEQCLRLVELPRFDRDVGHDPRHAQAGREVALPQHPQRDPGGSVGLGERAQPQAAASPAELCTAISPRALPARLAASIIAGSAASTGPNRSAVINVHSSAARVSQFAAQAARRPAQPRAPRRLRRLAGQQRRHAPRDGQRLRRPPSPAPATPAQASPQLASLQVGSAPVPATAARPVPWTADRS